MIVWSLVPEEEVSELLLNWFLKGSSVLLLRNCFLPDLTLPRLKVE